MGERKTVWSLASPLLAAKRLPEAVQRRDPPDEDGGQRPGQYRHTHHHIVHRLSQWGEGKQLIRQRDRGYGKDEDHEEQAGWRDVQDHAGRADKPIHIGTPKAPAAVVSRLPNTGIPDSRRTQPPKLS